MSPEAFIPRLHTSFALVTRSDVPRHNKTPGDVVHCTAASEMIDAGGIGNSIHCLSAIPIRVVSPLD